MSNSEAVWIINGPETQSVGIYAGWSLREFLLVDSHMNYITVHRQNLDYRESIPRLDRTKISSCQTCGNGSGVVPLNDGFQQPDHHTRLSTISVKIVRLRRGARA